jgi:hypothetical protein
MTTKRPLTYTYPNETIEFIGTVWNCIGIAIALVVGVIVVPSYSCYFIGQLLSWIFA